jgi:hypothetical protein
VTTVVKRYAPTLAVALGLLAYLFSAYFLNRPEKVEASSGNLYSLDLKRDWLKIEELLGIEDLRLEDFRLEYESDGEIRDLRYQLVGFGQDDMMLYRVKFNAEEKVYSISGKKVDGWLQYERMVDARRFFDVLGNLEVKQLRPKEQHEAYMLQSDGWYMGFAIKERPKYEIVKNQLRELHDSELPVKAVSLVAYGMDKSGGSSNGAKHEGREIVHYLFDVQKE